MISLFMKKSYIAFRKKTRIYKDAFRKMKNKTKTQKNRNPEMEELVKSGMVNKQAEDTLQQTEARYGVLLTS